MNDFTQVKANLRTSSKQLSSTAVPFLRLKITDIAPEITENLKRSINEDVIDAEYEAQDDNYDVIAKNWGTDPYLVVLVQDSVTPGSIKQPRSTKQTQHFDKLQEDDKKFTTKKCFILSARHGYKKQNSKNSRNSRNAPHAGESDKEWFQGVVNARIQRRPRRVVILAMTGRSLFNRLPDSHRENLSETNLEKLQLTPEEQFFYDREIINTASFTLRRLVSELSSQVYNADTKVLDDKKMETLYMDSLVFKKATPNTKISVELLVGCDKNASKLDMLKYLRQEIWKNIDDDDDILVRPRNIKQKYTPGILTKVEKGHNFKKKYLTIPRNCTFCSQLIWGNFSAPGYECSECNMYSHGSCIEKIATKCKGYKPTESDVKHNFGEPSPKRSFWIRTCQQTGMKIYPFQTYYQCNNVKCNKIFSKEEHKLMLCVNDRTEEEMNELYSQTNAQLESWGECDYLYGDTNFNLDPDGIREMIDFETEYQYTKVSYRADKEPTGQELHKTYEIVKQLGSGTYGTVFMGYMKKSKSKKPLAIKGVRKDLALNDYGAAAIIYEKECLFLNNPFLVKAISTFQDKKFLYFVMVFVQGGNLLDFLKKHKTQPAEVIDGIGLGILYGLNFLHEKKWVYRDIKLENVMLDTEGHAVIADFGMMRKNCTQYDLCTTICGTPEYMAPEIINEDPYDFKVDVWAWGVCMFELLTCFSPFVAKSEHRLKINIRTKDPDWTKCSQKNKHHKKPVNSSFKKLVDKCLTKDANNRPTAKDAINDPYFTKKYGNYTSNFKELKTKMNGMSNLLKPSRDTVRKANQVDKQSGISEQLSSFINDASVRPIASAMNYEFETFGQESPALKKEYLK